MPQVKLKGLNIRRNSAGKWYVSIRRSGISLVNRFEGTRDDLARHMATPEFLAQFSTAKNQGIKRTYAPGTFGSLIDWYMTRDTWLDLAPRTRQDYQKVALFLEPTFDYNVLEITKADVAELRDRAIKSKYPKFSNDVIAFMSAVFREATEYNRMPENPALGVRRKYRPSKNANRAWTQQEWDFVSQSAPENLIAPLFLIRWAGLRGQDVAKIRWSAHKKDPEMGHVIAFTPLKNGAHYGEVVVGVLPPLQAVLCAQKRNTLTIAHNSLGKPYPSENAMRKAWGDFKNSDIFKENLPKSHDLTLHGLRVTYASMIKEAGFDDRAVADAIGDASESMGHRYARGANKKINSVRIFKALENYK